MFKKPIFKKIGFFQRETEGKRARTGNKNRIGCEIKNGGGKGNGAGTGNVLDPSNAGYPPLVVDKCTLLSSDMSTCQ
jgi:hypothetical protein